MYIPVVRRLVQHSGVHLCTSYPLPSSRSSPLSFIYRLYNHYQPCHVPGLCSTTSDDDIMCLGIVRYHLATSAAASRCVNALCSSSPTMSSCIYRLYNHYQPRHVPGLCGTTSDDDIVSGHCQAPSGYLHCCFSMCQSLVLIIPNDELVYLPHFPMYYLGSFCAHKLYAIIFLIQIEIQTYY